MPHPALAAERAWSAAALQTTVVQAPLQGTATQADEPWRLQLTRGDSVEVLSHSAGSWVPGTVLKVSRDRVQVAYVVGCEKCDKVLLRASPDLRQPRSAMAAAPAAVKAYAESPSENRRWVEAAGLAALAAASVVSASKAGEERLAAPPPGEWLKLADLHMGEILGSGGFGSVHRGMLRGEGVAIKRLHLGDNGQISTQQLEEFQKEVANLQALRHPRLIRFIGVALELPVMCIVTELASGGSLYALLHVHRVLLPEVHKRTLVLQISEGVAFLHAQQPPCVHRDLKSANVVLDAEHNAKLCDFGLTESMDKTHISRRETEAGSPRYMAPEVFDSRRKLTEKLDIWALGCLAVEVQTGRMPHEDCATLQQVAAKLLVRLEGPFEDCWAAGFRPEARRLVGACLARDAAARPGALALLEGLGRLESLALPCAELRALSRA